MTEVLRGKLKGQTVKVLQFCNDWFYVEVDGHQKIVSPLSLRLDEQELRRIAQARDTGDVGSMF